MSHWRDPLYRQAYLMMASTGVSAATGLLFWVVAALRVRPDVLGIAAGLVAANAFMSYLTSFALPYAMLRFGGVDAGAVNRINASLLASTVSSVVAAAGFAAAAAVVAPVLAPHLHTWVDVMLFAASGVGAAAAGLLDNLLAARRRAGTVLARNLAAAALRLLPLLWLTAGDARGLYLAVTLPVLVTAAVVLLGLRRLVPGYRHDTLVRLPVLRADPAVRELAAFAARNYPSALLSGAPQFALPLLAVNLLGPYRNAFFYVAWSMAQIVYLVPSVISSISLSQGTSSSAVSMARRSRTLALCLLTPVIGVALLAPALLLRWYGASYAHSATPLRLLMLAAVPWTIVIITQSRLRTEHRFTALTALCGLLCLLAIGLPVGLAPAFGSDGMASGWLLALTLTAVASIALVRPASRSRPGPDGLARTVPGAPRRGLSG